MNAQQLPSDGSQGQWNQQQDSGQYRPSIETQFNPWSNGNDGRWETFAHPHHASHLTHHGDLEPPNVPPFPNTHSSMHSLFELTMAVDPNLNPKTAPPPVSLRNPPFPDDLQLETVPEIPDASRSTRKKKSRLRGRIHDRINPSDWEKYKGYLKKLYIEKRKTVPHIMEHMKRDFNFDASEQQYKNKFSDWGFSKNLPKAGLPDEVAQWIVSKSEERDRDGKKTEFVWENRMVPTDRIQESARQGKFQSTIRAFDTPTPVGLTYSTPVRVDIVPSPFKIDTISPRPPDNPRSNPVSDVQPMQPPHLRLTWKGYNRADFEAMIADAKVLTEFGKLEEAEDKFREALTGLQNLLSPANERTVLAAYEFAEFYAKNVRMHDADEILEWISVNIVKAWGLEHQKSIKHMLHVVDLYCAWSRPNDAVTLLLRAVEYLEDPPVSNELLVQEANKDTLQKAPTISTRWFQMSENSGPSDKPGYLEFQFVVANAQARARDEEAEPLLLDLIKQCERFPEQFAVQSFKAHSSLLGLYHELGKLDKLRPALHNAEQYFFNIMKEEAKGKKVAVCLLNAAVDLVGHFVQAGKSKVAEAMFNLLEETITGTLDPDGTDSTIDLLIAIGIVYQTHGKWKNARPRFEHALAITLASRGPESKMGRRLQAALENKSFSMASFSSLDFNALRRSIAESYS